METLPGFGGSKNIPGEEDIRADSLAYVQLIWQSEVGVGENMTGTLRNTGKQSLAGCLEACGRDV